MLPNSVPSVDLVTDVAAALEGEVTFAVADFAIEALPQMPIAIRQMESSR